MDLIYVSLLLITAASAATAQAPGIGTPSAAAHPQNARIGSDATRTPSPVGSSFLKLDTNHDGVLSTEEMNAVAGNAASVRFQQLDTDHDGKISAAEYSAAQAKAGRQSEAGPPGSTTSDPTGAAHASRTPGSKTPGSTHQ